MMSALPTSALINGGFTTRSGAEVFTGCKAMLQNDRVGFIARKPDAFERPPRPL